MKLSEIKEVLPECNLIRDCEFDELFLIGKDYDKNRRIVTFLQNEKFIDSFLHADVDAVICTEEIYQKISNQYSGGVCISKEPKNTFFLYHNHLATNTSVYSKKFKSCIDKSAAIHPTALISEECVIIGKNVTVCAHAVIKENTTIADNVMIREGCIIGGPAFYYFGEGDHCQLVESAGGVFIEENAELHANVIVERGIFGSKTKIGRNVKLDNAVFIGHDCMIERDCKIAGQCMLAGNVKVDQGSFLGVAVAISPNVKLGSNTKASAGAVITKNVPDSMQVTGNFAIEHNKFIENLKQSADIKNTQNSKFLQGA